MLLANKGVCCRVDNKNRTRTPNINNELDDRERKHRYTQKCRLKSLLRAIKTRYCKLYPHLVFLSSDKDFRRNVRVYLWFYPSLAELRSLIIYVD